METIKKIAIYLFLFSLLLLFIWAAFVPKGDFTEKVQETLKEQRRRTDLFFRGATFAEIVNGVKYWELHARTSDINKDIKLATMKDVDGLFFKNGKAALKILAPTAEWKMDEKEIFLDEPIGYDIKYERKVRKHLKKMGDVRELFSIFHLPSKYPAESELGYWFKAHNLNWSIATKKIICKKGITLTKGDVTVFSEKLEGDVGLEKVKLSGFPKALISGRDGGDITIEAKVFDIDSPNDMIYAKGNVKIIRGAAIITSNNAVYNQKEGFIELTSNVSTIFEDIKAWGDEGIYSVKEESAALTGNAGALRGQSKLFGDKVIVFIKDGKIVIEGKTRVTIGEEELPKAK